MKKSLLAVLASGAWVSASEFARNELAFKSSWIEKFNSNGMTFPSDLMNNALWVSGVSCLPAPLSSC